jgi:solute carrier family 25 protein 46
MMLGTHRARRRVHVLKTMASWPPGSTMPSERDCASYGCISNYDSVFIGMVVTHPCVVMRRQCQLHVRADTLHLLPFTLLQPVWHVQNTQGTIVLWKGVFASLIHAASVRAVERALADVNRWPLRVHQHSSARHIGQHCALKMYVAVFRDRFFLNSSVCVQYRYCRNNTDCYSSAD